jgi:hypothetical protein
MASDVGTIGLSQEVADALGSTHTSARFATSTDHHRRDDT